MQKDLSDYRQDYNRFELLEESAPSQPFTLFDEWFQDAIKADIPDCNAMNLCTIDSNGFPNSRIVLVKEYTDKGFVFFTNYKSKKGEELAENNKVCLNFFWQDLHRQIRIKGLVSKISPEESTAYYLKRPAGSRIGAWASPQSQIIENRAFLEKRVEEEIAFRGETPKERPDFWGGYIVKPEYFEFWQGRTSRLHDRICYEREESKWIKNRLAP